MSLAKLVASNELSHFIQVCVKPLILEISWDKVKSSGGENEGSTDLLWLRMILVTEKETPGGLLSQRTVLPKPQIFIHLLPANDDQLSGLLPVWDVSSKLVQIIPWRISFPVSKAWTDTMPPLSLTARHSSQLINSNSQRTSSILLEKSPKVFLSFFKFRWLQIFSFDTHQSEVFK